MLRSAVAAIHAAADEVADVERGLAAADPGASAFGASGLGLLGDVSREAYRHYQVALDARAREARAHAERLRGLAQLIERTGTAFAEADDAAMRDQRGRAGPDDPLHTPRESGTT
jgi:hypothetical protein